MQQRKKDNQITKVKKKKLEFMLNRLYIKS